MPGDKKHFEKKLSAKEKKIAKEVKAQYKTILKASRQLDILIANTSNRKVMAKLQAKRRETNKQLTYIEKEFADEIKLL